MPINLSTDPSKADNPIVFASDGFVNVTGMSSTEMRTAVSQLIFPRVTQDKRSSHATVDSCKVAFRISPPSDALRPQSTTDRSPWNCW